MAEGKKKQMFSLATRTRWTDGLCWYDEDGQELGEVTCTDMSVFTGNLKVAKQNYPVCACAAVN